MLKAVLIIAAFVAFSHAVNIVEDCGPSDAYIKFSKLDITPMPFDLFGKILVEADVTTQKVIGSKVRMSVKIKKNNLGGKFTWEVPCSNIGLIGDQAEGFEGYIGTCEYAGSCDFPFIKTWTSEGSCPSFFADYDIPCTCPFPPKTFTTKGKIEVDLSRFKDRMPSWLIEGGYEVSAELRDTVNNDKLVGCLKLKFDVKAALACTPTMIKFKLNGC